jgi:hypothetical protein
MKLLKQALAVLGTVVVIAVLVALVTPKTAQAIVATAVYVMNTPNVNVVNTPLPITNAEVHDLNNNPAPGPLITEDTGNPAYEPFAATLCVSFGGTSCGFPSSLTVPTKTADFQPVTRLVIEYVSGDCQASGGLDVELFSNSSGNSGGFSAVNRFSLNPTPTGGWYEFSQHTRIYADPGTNLGPNFSYTGPTPNYLCNMVVNGHFVVAAVPTVF